MLIFARWLGAYPECRVGFTKVGYSLVLKYKESLNSVFANKYGKIWCWLRNLREFTNRLIPVFHRYATICLYSVYFKYLLVYQYSDSLPTNTNKELFGHFRLFIIIGHVFDKLNKDSAVTNTLAFYATVVIYSRKKF
jgi:hypothetical protein